jgi:hypothetical protein
VANERVAGAREAKRKAAALVDDRDRAADERRGRVDGVGGFDGRAAEVSAAYEEGVAGRGVDPGVAGEAASGGARRGGRRLGR